jgi:hypothetical protein
MTEAYASELTLSSYSMLLSVDDSYLLNPNAYIPSLCYYTMAPAPVLCGLNIALIFQNLFITFEVKGLRVNGVSATLYRELAGGRSVLMALKVYKGALVQRKGPMC